MSDLDSQLFAAGAEKLIGIRPLSHFAPLRIGAEDRKDVIAERTLGLCKYLDHVLKCTEPPAPKFLVQLMDGFVTKLQPFDSTSESRDEVLGWWRATAVAVGFGRCPALLAFAWARGFWTEELARLPAAVSAGFAVFGTGFSLLTLLWCVQLFADCSNDWIVLRRPP